MKLTKTLCCLGIVLALSLTALGVYAQADDPQNTGEVCSREQCERIIDDAMERYGITVPDVAEYKDYLWSEVQANALSPADLEENFRENFENAAERRALNQARAADEIINTATEAMAVLDEINKENYTAYILGAGEFAQRADYLDSLQLDHDAFKAQLESELENDTAGGIAEHLDIENLNRTIPGPPPRTVREQAAHFISRSPAKAG